MKKIEDNKDKYEDMDKSNIIKEYLYKDYLKRLNFNVNNKVISIPSYRNDISSCLAPRIETVFTPLKLSSTKTDSSFISISPMSE